MVKKKTDPVDGCAHSLAELEEKYKGKYKKKARPHSTSQTPRRP
jgi:hypothetical protein